MCRRTLPVAVALLVLAGAAPAQQYTIKIKVGPDVGNTVTYRQTGQAKGNFGFYDAEDMLLNPHTDRTTEQVYTDTVLERQDGIDTVYIHVFEKVTETKAGEKAAVKSYQGRTVLYERKKEKSRAGVVGKERLPDEDLQRLGGGSSGESPISKLLKYLPPAKPVQAGDTWKLPEALVTSEPESMDLDKAKSVAEAKLVKVSMKDKTPVGEFEIKISRVYTGIKGGWKFDPPVTETTVETLEVAIDGTSAQYTLRRKMEIKGKGKLRQGKEAVGRYESDASMEAVTERSAEKDDAKAREKPAVAYWSDEAVWKTYTYKDDKFSLDFPGKPKEEFSKDEEDNSTKRMATVEREGGDVRYSALCHHSAQEINEEQAKGFLADLAKSLEGTVKSKKEVQQNGFPGLEIVRVLDTPFGKAHIAERVVVTKNRIYVLQAEARESKKDLLEADKFFKSFKFEDKKDQEGGAEATAARELNRESLMARNSFVGAPILLLALACAAVGQTYTIKIKVEPDPGKSVTCGDVTKRSVGLKWYDMNGKLTKDGPATDKEVVYTDTILEKDKDGWTKLKRVYEKATEKEGDAKVAAKSYQGRTVVLERKGGIARVGVVGKEDLDSSDLEKLADSADETSSDEAVLKHLAPDKPVKVGDTWKMDMKAFTATFRQAQLDPEHSSIEVKLVKVFTKDKTQFGVFELKTTVALGGFKDKYALDPPLVWSGTETVEVAIDGSSTQYTYDSHTEGSGKAKVIVDKKPVGQVESGGKQEGRSERSAEKDDPKGREAPEVSYWSDKPRWSAVASKEDKYTLDFPGKPKEDVKKDDKTGGTTRTLTAEAAKGEVMYMVTSGTYPAEFADDDAKKILEATAKSYEKTSKSKKDISINGFPGIEIVHVVKQPGGDLYAVQRMYVVKNRVYMVLAMARETKKDLLEAERFFKSFKIEDRKDQ